MISITLFDSKVSSHQVEADSWDTLSAKAKELAGDLPVVEIRFDDGSEPVVLSQANFSPQQHQKVTVMLGEKKPAAPATAELFVSDLDQSANEDVLMNIFSAYGAIVTVRVCRDAFTRAPLGYAYVTFQAVEDAKRAMEELNFAVIQGKQCRVMWSIRDPALRKSGVGNVVVKNIAKSVDSKAFFDTFSKFGPVLSCKLAKNSQGESLGYGFVHYQNEEDAKTVLDSVNGLLLAGQKIAIEAFKNRAQSPDSFTNIFVKNLPLVFSSQQFSELCASFGEVTHSKLALDDQGGCRGFGFCSFASHEEALRAVEALNGKMLPGQIVPLFSSREMTREERKRENRQRIEEMKKLQRERIHETLFVKNLPDSLDSSQLRELFEPFGSILSCNIMTSARKKSRGFAFITFDNPRSAAQAISSMNGLKLMQKTLYVSYFKSKEQIQQERMRQMQVQFGLYYPQYQNWYAPQMFQQPIPHAPLFPFSQPQLFFPH